MRHSKHSSGDRHEKSARGRRVHLPGDSLADHGQRGRMRHGDVRVAILLALSEGPAHGYEIGQRLLRASGGNWQPSPGSIYPTLETLHDEEMVTSEWRDGKRIYTIAKKGREEIAAREKRGEANPWDSAMSGPGGELKEAVISLKMAAKQIGGVGKKEQIARAIEIVTEARRALYELLAKG